MTAAILHRGLRIRRRSMIAWAVGSAAFTAMVVAIFPVLRDDPTFDELLAEYPEPVLALIGGDVGLTTGPGFLSAELYSLVLPVLVAVIATMAAAGSVGGEDERGWLALVTAGPISRRRVVVESAIVVALVAAGPVAASAIVVAVGDPMVDLDMGLVEIAAASLTVWIFGLVFGAIAIAAGGLVGRRSAAVSAGIGALFFAYGAEIVGATASWGRPLQEISPFHHLVGAQPAITGTPWLEVAVAAAAAGLAVVFAIDRIESRDLVG